MSQSRQKVAGLVVFLCACLCSEGSPDIRAKISSASVNLKKINDTFHETKISFTCDISSTQKRIKKPLMLFRFLREDDGSWLYNACLVDDSARTANITTNMADQSAKQVEVDSEKYRRFQATGERGWIFGSRGKNRILAYRCELWIDGILAASFDSLSPSLTKQLGIPADWYVEGKYSDKIIYK